MRAMRQPGRFNQLAMILAMLALVAVQARAASHYSVILDPPSFGVDEASELTITVRGDEDAAPIIPHVPGLAINADGNSESLQQINGGAVIAVFTRTYRVTADHAGTYTIAPIQIADYRSPPLTVHVGAAGSGRRGSPSGDDADEDSRPAASLAAALRAAMPVIKVMLPKAQLYAGELVPMARFHDEMGDHPCDRVNDHTAQLAARPIGTTDLGPDGELLRSWHGRLLARWETVMASL